MQLSSSRVNCQNFILGDETAYCFDKNFRIQKNSQNNSPETDEPLKNQGLRNLLYQDLPANKLFAGVFFLGLSYCFYDFV